jgi:hypothetical protein
MGPSGSCRRVPYTSVLLVARVTWTDELTAQRRHEFVDGALVNRNSFGPGQRGHAPSVDLRRQVLSGTSPLLPRDEPGRIQDHNVAAFGAYHAIPAKFPQLPYDHFPHRPDGIGQLLLTDRDDDLDRRLTLRSPLRREVEEMSRHTLAHGCEGVSRDLVYEAQHPITELAEEGLSNSCITCNCPANHGWRQPQELGVHQCLRRRRHSEAPGEQRYGADECAGPGIAHSHRPTVGSGYEAPDDARDHQLKVRSGFTFSMGDRASRNLHSDRARQELFDHVRWQLMQVRLQYSGA